MGVTELFGSVLFVVIAVGSYFLPTIIATKRDHHQAGAITIINIFLGWTILGWVICLAWSCSAVKKTAAAQINPKQVYIPDPNEIRWKKFAEDYTQSDLKTQRQTWKQLTAEQKYYLQKKYGLVSPPD